MWKKIACFFISAFLCLFNLPTAYAVTDTEGPKLIRVIADKTDFNAEETLTFKIVATDDLSGINLSMGSVTLSGARGGGAWLEKTDEKDTYLFKILIDKDLFPTGDYPIYVIILTDNLNNSKEYRAGVDFPNITFHITNNLRTDWTGPELKGVSLQIISGKTGLPVSTAVPGDKICFTVKAQDPAGISEGCVDFCHTESRDWYYSVDLVPLAAKPGQYYGEYIVPKYLPDGLFKICHIYLSDGLFNFSEYYDRRYTQADLPLPEKMILPIPISNPGVGIERPKPFVKDLKISPQRVKQGDPVTFTMRVDLRGNVIQDDKIILFFGYSGDGYESGAKLTKKSEGVYKGKAILSGDAPYGKYSVLNAFVYREGDSNGIAIEWPDNYYNQYHRFKGPTFDVLSVYSGIKNVTLPAGSPSFDPLAGVRASNETFGDMTASIQVEGSVDTQKPGLYLLKYTIEKTRGELPQHFYEFRWVGVTDLPPDPSDPNAPLALTQKALTIGAKASDITVQRDGKTVAYANTYTQPGEYTVFEKSSGAKAAFSAASAAAGKGAKAVIDSAGPAIDCQYDVPMNKIKVKVQAADFAGVKTLKYMQGKRDWQTVYASGKNIKSSGSFAAVQHETYTIISQDYFGNKSKRTLKVNAPLDKTGPNVAFGIGGKKTNILVTLDVKDPAGFTVLKYLFGEKTAAEVKAKGADILKKQCFITPKEGVYTVFAQDGCGNTSLTRLKIDFIPIRELLFGNNPVEVSAGETYQTRLVVRPTTSSNKTFTYTSSNTKIAKVDKNGVITAYKKGKATITAVSTDGSGKRAAMTVVVK